MMRGAYVNRARDLWRLANEIKEASRVWPSGSPAAQAHIIAAAALYGLSQAISDAGGQPLTSSRSDRECGYESALLENLAGVARLYGSREAAELAYRLADGIATGEMRR